MHSPSQQIVFTNVSVIPMDSELILEDQTVVIEGDRIVQVAPSSEVNAASNATIIDGDGKYLMPGLAEMHGHVPLPIPDLTHPIILIISTWKAHCFCISQPVSLRCAACLDMRIN